jgi:hypothetical protein
MFITAAIDTGKPPTAMILNDVTHTEYDEWDFKLVKAHYLKASMMSGNFPVWIDQSDRVEFDVKEYTSKSEAALDKKKELATQGGNPNYGVAYYAVPRVIDGGPMPTMKDYIEEQKNKTRNALADGRIKRGTKH